MNQQSEEKPTPFKSKLVSIIIPTYNCASYLKEAIDSVLEQTFTDYEVIVIDDGSTDETEQVLQSYSDQIQYIYQTNQGVAAARNRGLAEAQGTFISFLDADDSFYPEKLAQQVEYFQNSPSLGLVIAGWRTVTESNKVISKAEPWEAWPSLNLESALLCKPARPSAMMVHRRWIEKIGSFDCELQSAEDLDWLLRLMIGGCEAAWLPEVLVNYRQRSGSLMAQGDSLITSTKEVMQRFFKRSDLPQGIKALEHRERYQSWSWLAARMHYDGYLKEMKYCLKQSLRHTSEAGFEIASDWFQVFRGYAKEYGHSFDAYFLTNTAEWKSILRLLLPSPFEKLAITLKDEQLPKKVESQKILLYSDDPGAGGILQCNHAIACHLARCSYDVSHVHFLQDTPLNQQECSLGIQQVDLGYHAGADLTRTLKDLEGSKQHFLDARPDLIIFSDGWPFSNLAAKQAAIDLNIPYIIVLGFIEPSCVNYDYQDGVDYKKLVALQYARAQTVIAVSQENLLLLRQLFNLPESVGQVIYNGRPEIFFAAPDLQSRRALRQELDIPMDAIVCFTSARLEAIKGYQYQIEAIGQLKQSPVWSRLYFVWAGVGVAHPSQESSYEAELRVALEELGVAERVKFLGQRWDIPELLDASDIFVLTSEAEGMPLSVMEAMAKGLPVVASAVSGIPEELGETGQLLPDPNRQPEETVRVLVKTIERWAGSEQLRQSLGQACCQRAEAMFREAMMVQQYEEVVAHCWENAKESHDLEWITAGLSLRRREEIQQQFRYSCWVWLAWSRAQQGDFECMGAALEEALCWAGLERDVPVVEWGQRFSQFCKERGVSFHSYEWTRSPAWRSVVGLN